MEKLTATEARNYFKKSGLTILDIFKNKDLLIKNLEKELQKYTHLEIKVGATEVVGISLENPEPEKYLESFHIRVNSPYFVGREGISFNSDGFISFSSWSTRKQREPFLKAFVKTIAQLISSKEIVELKDETHLVLKWEDVSKYLNESQRRLFCSLVDIISESREKDGKKINKYWICNTDEPYFE